MHPQACRTTDSIHCDSQCLPGRGPPGAHAVCAPGRPPLLGCSSGESSEWQSRLDHRTGGTSQPPGPGTGAPSARTDGEGARRPPCGPVEAQEEVSSAVPSVQASGRPTVGAAAREGKSKRRCGLNCAPQNVCWSPSPTVTCDSALFGNWIFTGDGAKL